MQVTKVSLYSLRMLARECAQGNRTIGYTVKPGFSNGLFLSGAYARGQYAGF